MAKLPTVPAFNIVTMMTLFIRVVSLIVIPAARLAYSRFIWRLPPFGGVGMRVIHKRPWFATLSLMVRSASVGVWPRVLDMVTSWGLRMMRSDLIILLMTCLIDDSLKLLRSAFEPASDRCNLSSRRQAVFTSPFLRRKVPLWSTWTQPCASASCCRRELISVPLEAASPSSCEDRCHTEWHVL